MKKLNLICCMVVLLFAVSSCKKEAGEGGNSSIRGKVYAKYYNKSFTILNGEAYAPDEDIYIIYGDEPAYGDRIKTAFDGSYEFKFLRKGKYKVYVYSKDSTFNVSQYPSGMYEVIANIEITSKKQVVEVPDLVVARSK